MRQSGFAMTGYLAAGGLIAVLGVTVLWQMERAESAGLRAELEAQQAEIDVLKSNQQRLEDALAGQRETIETFTKLAENRNDLTDTLTQRLYETQQEIHAKQSEIDSLRAGELRRSLERPFETGNLAHDRLLDGLRGIAGAPGGDHPDGDGAGTAGTPDAGDAAAGPD